MILDFERFTKFINYIPVGIYMFKETLEQGVKYVQS